MPQEHVQSSWPGQQEGPEAKSAAVVEAPRSGPIMVVAAHPDDIESWCAGTLALSLAKGVTVKLLLVTSGDKGSDEPTATTIAVAARREAEARAAAEHLGITEIVFLRLPDGEVEDTYALRKSLVSWIRRWQPVVLFTHDPEHSYPPYLAHRDHRITGRVALDAVYPLARDRLNFEELASDGLLPHKIAQVWLFSTTTPNAFVEITESFDRKLEARLAHQSQTSDPEALKVAWRRRAAAIGATVGLPLAESFMVLHLA